MIALMATIVAAYILLRMLIAVLGIVYAICSIISLWIVVKLIRKLM